MASPWPIEDAERIDDDHYIIIDDAEDAQDYCVVKGANAAKYARMISATPLMEDAVRMAITKIEDRGVVPWTAAEVLEVLRHAIKAAKGKQ